MLYEFMDTSDPAYCNEDSIIGGDCGIGKLYLLKNGKALYNEFCKGEDSVSYYRGSYEVNGAGLSCTFNSEYLYRSHCPDCPRPDANNKNRANEKFRDIDPWTLNLIKTECKEFDYYRQASQAEAGSLLKEGSRVQVYRKTSESRYYDFCNFLSSMETFSDFHCEPETLKATTNGNSEKGLLSLITGYYTSQNKKSTVSRSENDSLLQLAFTHTKKTLDDDGQPYLFVKIPKRRSAYLEGDLDGDGHAELVVQPVLSQGGSTYWKDITVLSRKGNGYTLRTVSSNMDLAVCRNGAYNGSFHPTAISGGALTGTSFCFTDEDEQCCPSVKTKTRVGFQNGKLKILR
jgi:hypothetical protein